jgi:hypothetical protein
MSKSTSHTMSTIKLLNLAQECELFTRLAKIRNPALYMWSKNTVQKLREEQSI